MKRVIIITFIAMLAITMASCNLNPADWDLGGDKDVDRKEKEDRDDDKKERDGMMVRGMEGDSFDTPCDFTFTIQSITVTENASDEVTDRKTDRTVLVQILVTYADGTVEAFTFTKDAPSVMVGDCTIYLKGVKPMKRPGLDAVSHVAMFAITTG